MFAQSAFQPVAALSTAAQVATLLRIAAEQVADDPDGTRTRIAEATALLGAVRSRCGCKATRTLAPWQERVVQAHIDRHLDEPLPIDALAQLARLSCGHFFRAFKGSFGTSPHSYVVQRRIVRSMQLLADTDEPLAQIAIVCGFADQAHFSRAFSRSIGIPPGNWRRQRRGLD